jgi:hypothetical protein
MRRFMVLLFLVADGAFYTEKISEEARLNVDAGLAAERFERRGQPAGSRSASSVLPAPLERSSSRPMTAISAAASGARMNSGTLSGSFSITMPLTHPLACGVPRPAVASTTGGQHRE